MAQFSVNAQRFDPYKNFKFRVKWDGKYVAGISKVTALKRTTEVVKHREEATQAARENLQVARSTKLLHSNGVSHMIPSLKPGRKRSGILVEKTAPKCR